MKKLLKECGGGWEQPGNGGEIKRERSILGQENIIMVLDIMCHLSAECFI